METCCELLGLKGKNIVVTGAAGGMGRALAEALCVLGANVYAGIHSSATLLPVAKECPVDMGDRNSIDTFMAQCPDRIWAVYCCHGVSCRPGREVESCTINFLGARYLFESLLPRMENGGFCGNISSVGGLRWDTQYRNEVREVMELEGWDCTVSWFRAHPKIISDAYSFSKACQCAYAKYHMPQFSKKNVRIVTWAAGATETKMSADFYEDMSRRIGETGPEAGKAMLETIMFDELPNARWADGADQGKPFALLCSPLFNFFTGQILVCDNGQMTIVELDNLRE